MNGLKKHRGLKRYYRDLLFKDDSVDLLDFDNPEIWFDHGHLHFDNKGYGNNSFKKRKPHLDKLFRHFEILAKKAQSLKTDFQLYAIILDHDSYNDALFLHTPNPNNSQFPFQISELQSTSTLTNKDLNIYIDNLVGYEKKYGLAGEGFCLLFKKNVGHAF